MVSVTKIRVNYLENPVGIQTVDQVGWVLVSDERNVMQESYQLQIARDSGFEDLIYDSGVETSDESAHVTTGPLKLSPSTKYYLRVQITSSNRQTSGWGTATFTTALLDNEQWKAEFVTAETLEDKDYSKGTYVRKTFRIDKQMKAAYAYVTALGLYHFYINGERVGSDEFTPGWTSYKKHLLYQIYDVTDLLCVGNNALGGLLGAGWYKGLMGFKGNRNNYGERTAFACQLHIAYADGSEEDILTDGTWKGADSPILFSEIYDGETYDARLEVDGWSTVELDDSAWCPVQAVNVNKRILTPQAGCKVAQMTSIPAKRIFKTPQGDTVIDFGQNLTGWIHFRGKGSAGARVELNCFEVLDAAGNVYVDNLRGAKQTITYICRDGAPIEYHPNFSYQGFRYAKISAWPGEPKAEQFTAWAVHSNMDETGSFECSNPDLNQLQHNIKWGMKGNFLDVPTDCPQRNERLGWTGDAQIFCRTASFLMNTYPFFTKWLRDVQADQTPEGGVPHVVPDIISGLCEDDWLVGQGTHSAAAWADVAVICPWTLYLTFGDKTVIEKQYSSMKAWIDYMRRNSKDGIWNYKLQFGDWVALDAEEGSYFGATPNDLTCTAYYAYSTGLFAKMAAVIGKDEDAKEYKKFYHEIVKTYQSHFFDETGHLTAQTQTAQIVTLYFNLAPEAYRQNVVNDLLALLKKENGHLVTGFVGTPYFCHALSQNGHVKEAYELLLKDDFPSWLYQVKMGATTVWEHWDGMKPDGTMWSPDMNSFNHYAYGAVGEWLYRVIAGLEIDEQAPGYKHSIIAPRVGGGLTHVKASYDSVYGPVRVEWNLDGNRVLLKTDIPCNTTADIILEDTAAVTDADGISLVKEGTRYQGTVGSGAHTIVYDLK